MDIRKLFRLFFCLLMISAILQPPKGSDARPVILKDQGQGFSKKFAATLGIVCKCCDGTEGECRSTWNGSCPKLQCLPWKLQ